jgi:Zn-dependent peptidase ImmA (M78 family)
MSNKMQVNGEMLRWARERTGMSCEEVAKKIKKPSDLIEDWEQGKKHPTYAQLEKLAYTIYGRPLALFFFPEPPEEEDIKQSFRTLPDSEIKRISPRIRYLLRQAKVLQLNAYELFDGANPTEKMITRELKFSTTDNVRELSRKVRNYFDVPIEKQKKWKSNEIALENWRNIIEKHGTLIFKDSFKDHGKNKPNSPYSGFCLYDDVFPIIYVNNNFSKPRQIFTLFHELAHLLFSVGGVDKRGGDDYLEHLDGQNHDIEILCNKFAAEFLIPSDEVNPVLQKIPSPADEQLSKIADIYCVSREVVLRRMLDLEIVDKNFYEERTEQWNEDWREKQKAKITQGGGNYYNTKNVYLSGNYIERVFAQYYQKRITIDQVADYLGQKVSNLDAFEKRVLTGGDA